MPTGTVKKVLNGPGQGYGFIKPDETGSDLFFHAADLLPALDFGEHLQGLQVAFEITDGRKGPRAANVREAK